MPRSVKASDPYTSSLLKYIPTEIVAAYLVIQGMIPEDRSLGAFLTTLIVSAVMLALTPLYLSKVQGVRSADQLVVTTVSFLVWLYTLGGPFTYLGLHVSYVGSAALVIWTLVIPLLLKPKAPVESAAGEAGTNSA